MKLRQILEAKYVGQEQEQMRPIVVDVDHDRDYSDLYDLFSEDRGNNFPIDQWEAAKLIFAYFEDQMGADNIYFVDGRFSYYDRHTGDHLWAPKGTTEDDVLNALGYYDDDDEEDW